MLAVDLGRTGCRATLWDGEGEHPLASADGEGSVGLTAAEGPEVAEQAILSVVAPLLTRMGVLAVDRSCIGAPGALVDPERARQLAQKLVVSIPSGAVAVTSDAITSHAGALAGAPGVVLAAGTGAVVVAIGAAGQFQRVDGWGPWLGDEGSGAWLGRAGLRAAARAYDGRGPATRLQAAAQAQFGAIGTLAVRLSADPNPARTVAAFAPAVAAAARQGDEVAAHMLHDAAMALADSILAGAAILNETGMVPVVILGGLTKMGTVLLDPLLEALSRGEAGLRVQPAKGTSSDGARWLATHDDGIHEPWMVRVHQDVVRFGDSLATSEGHRA
ncbi:MAG TPA: BadF/BadG/BcrA/BcrD ATPase family protein [Rhodanobacter sp.]|nr:BadF/BadG/BcrA/BcrD ATPase family protein [Rhodanobacter sp.]